MSRLRGMLMAGASVLVGFGTIAGAGHQAAFGQGLTTALVDQSAPIPQANSEVAKLLDRARQALAQNQPKLAVIFLKNALATDPKNSKIHLELGEALLQGGDVAAAERELRSARQYGASDQRVLPMLFATMLRRSETQQLLKEFPAPDQKDTSKLASETLRARATALNQSGNSNAAAVALDRALSFDRSAANLMARAQLARGQSDAALATKLLDEALSKSPKNVDALLAKVDLLVQTKQPEKALETANDLAKLYPDSAQALITRAGVYLDMHQYENAMKDIDASLKIAPNLALGVYYKAVAFEQAKDAKQAWDLAQKLPPEFVNSRPQIGAAVSQMAIDAGHQEIGTSILAGAVAHFPKDVDVRVRLAARYLQVGDAVRALQTLRPTEDSTDPRIMVLLAQAYDMQHQYAKSVEYLEKASAAGAGGDPLKRQLAVANMEAGKVDAALAELGNLSAASPTDAQTAGILIAALMQKGDYARALDVAKKLASSAPKSPYGPLYEGRLLLQRGDFDGAVSAFSRAVHVDGKFIPALYERALALAGRGDLKEADADLHTILSQDPQNEMAQIKLAEFAIRDGENDKAIQVLKQATTAHPMAPSPALMLAGLDVRQGRLEDAAAVVATFLKKVPDNANALFLQGQIQLSAGKVQDAISTFRQLSDRYPKSPQIQMLLAAALARNGNAKESLASYQKAAQLAPGLEAAQVALIQSALASKNEGLALSTAQNYAQKQPGPASAITLARTYATLKRNSEAVEILEKSQKEHPSGSTVLFLSGLLRAQGNSEKANAILTDWLAKHPDDVAVRLGYADTLLEANPKQAEDQYRAVLKSQPYNIDGLNNLGWLLQRKNPKEAVGYIERAAKIAPTSAAVLDTLGWTKWQLNDKADALSTLERAHTADSSNGEITYHLVRALDGNNRRADAKKLLGELLASKRSFPDRSAAETLQTQWQ